MPSIPRSSKGVSFGWTLVLTALPLTGVSISASDARSQTDDAAFIELTISPAAELKPALQLHLLPRLSERKRGSAYPFYARLTGEENDGFKKHVGKAAEFLKRPLAECKSPEVKQYLTDLERLLNELRMASLRDRCDWEYPIGEMPAMYMRLPDANEIRMFARVAALQMRYCIAEDDFTAAIDWARVCLAMSRHSADGPFLVNDLVGVAVARITLEQFHEYVQVDSPNVYWALTMLPTPYIDIRDSLGGEYSMLEDTIFELRDLDQLRTNEQWRSVLRQLIELRNSNSSKFPTKGLELASYLTKSRAKAERYFRRDGSYGQEQLEAMSLEEILVRWMVDPYAAKRDDTMKWMYVPWHSANRLRPTEDAPSDPDQSEFLMESLSWGNQILKAPVLLDQRIAYLQVIEAIRMHLAEYGKLPKSLDEIRTVPVPRDPLTGKSFDYRLTGKTATLKSFDESPDIARYRIHVRSNEDK